MGEPGVGKSRRFYEFTRSHRNPELADPRGSSVSYGKATSYLPVIDLLKGYFRIGDRDTHREIRERVTGRSSRWIAPSSRRSRRCSPSSTSPPTTLSGRRSIPRSAGSAPGSSPASASPRGARATAPRYLRGSALDRLRDAGVPRQPRGQLADRAAAAPRQLSARVPARVEQAQLDFTGPGGEAVAGQGSSTRHRAPTTGSEISSACRLPSTIGFVR
jgi:hypothetical protein